MVQDEFKNKHRLKVNNEGIKTLTVESILQDGDIA